MPGPLPGGSPEREAGAVGRPGGPGRGRRVRFRLPHTAIALPSVCEEERLFYRRLEALAAPGPGGFGPLFAADGWSDLTEDRLLRKRVVRDGQGGPRPRPGQEVSVKVLGALEDGGLVERDPRLSFVPGHGDVVQALELGVPTMQPGEVSFFLAAFPYGYGRPGREPDVPPEAPLLFEVTLLEVRDGPERQRLPPAALLRLGAQRRERGNFHFARGDFAAALRSYRLALRALDGPAAAPPGPQEEEELREQRVKCFNNCAAAELKLQRAGEALAACEAALRISPDNGRALLRRGQLLAQQGRDAEAALVLRRALELDPTSKVIHAELSRLAKRRSPPAPQEPRHGPAPPPSPGCVGAPANRAARGRAAAEGGRGGGHGGPSPEPPGMADGLRGPARRLQRLRAPGRGAGKALATPLFPPHVARPAPRTASGPAPRVMTGRGPLPVRGRGSAALAPAPQLPAFSPPPAEWQP